MSSKPIAFRHHIAQHHMGIGAVILVIVLALGVAVRIERTKPVYVETATVLFTSPPTDSSAAAYTWLAESLISTGAVICQVLASPQIKSRVVAAGGRAQYNMALVNLYNEDYPDYGYPEATLTAYSPSAASTHHTFVILREILARVLATRQRQAGAPAGDRIVVHISSDSGPVAESGSPKRALGGLLVLSLVLGGTAWNIANTDTRPFGQPRHRRAG
jgi:hypothetical protein